MKINKLAWRLCTANLKRKYTCGCICTGISLYLCLPWDVFVFEQEYFLYFYMYLCLHRNVKRKCKRGRFFTQQNKFLCPSFTLNNSSRHLSCWQHNFIELFIDTFLCAVQGCTNRCSLAARLRGNEKRMRK